MKVAINGFGRIGRMTMRALAERYRNAFIDVVAVNDLSDPVTNALLFKHDTVYGGFRGKFSSEDVGGKVIFNIDHHKVAVLNRKEIKDLPWGELGVDVVIEATGAFTKREDLEKHLSAGARKVILTAPSATAKDVDFTTVIGVNDGKLDRERHLLISNASCTTNCLAPIAKILNDNFGIVQGMMTTTHSYTNDQRVQDLVHKDPRRARAAAMNIIPATTGAAKAIGLVIPELGGKILGDSLRVPVAAVSVVDLTAFLCREVSREEVDDVLKDASLGRFRGILGYCRDPLVSSDFIGDSHSAIIDGLSTVVSGNMVKIRAWYDNEWGYSSRVTDLIAMAGGIPSKL